MGKRYEQEVPKEEIKMASECMKKNLLISSWRHTNKIMTVHEFSLEKLIENI